MFCFVRELLRFRATGYGYVLFSVVVDYKGGERKKKRDVSEQNNSLHSIFQSIRLASFKSKTDLSLESLGPGLEYANVLRHTGSMSSELWDF